MKSEKKSNNSIARILNRVNLALAALLLFSIFLTGCGQKSWQDPLAENYEKTARNLVAAAMKERDNCTCCLDAELTATWTSRAGDGGFEGYVKVLQPSSIKIVAVNPLGQPLYALATNGRTFQTINVESGVFKYGKVASFEHRHSIPENIFHEDWANWVTGAMAFTDDQLTQLYQDKDGRGFWLAIQREENNTFPQEYLLFDPVRKRLVERVPIDSDGDESGRILYDNWKEIDGCPIPASISVIKDDYNTNIDIELKNILIDKNFDKKNFFLKPPSGYLQQFYP